MEYQTRKQKEFEKIYLEYKDVIYHVSLYYTCNDEVASEEITQKVFYDLYLHFENANIEFLYTYLWAAARNTAFTWAKRHKRLVYVSSDDMIDHECSDTRTPEDVYFREQQKKVAKELKESILQRLWRKNKLWYEAVYLVHFLEKPHAQVAEELGIDIAALHSRLYRANQWIRKNYRQEYDEVLSWTS